MEQSAAVRTREIYRSPNGDRWLLARGFRHEPIFPQVDRSHADRSLSHRSRQWAREARAPAPDWNSGLGVPSRSRCSKAIWNDRPEGLVNSKNSTPSWGTLQKTL